MASGTIGSDGNACHRFVRLFEDTLPKTRLLCRIALEYGCQDDCGVEVDQEEQVVCRCKDSTHRVHVL